MGKVIPVTVRDKIATASKAYLYICGNSDFSIEFDFDAEWDAYDIKTARFSYNGTYQDVVFEGNECPVPVISNTYNFKVGAFAGNLRTTTPAYVSAKKSILCEGGSPAAPADDVYAQVMERLNLMEENHANYVVEEQLTQAIGALKDETEGKLNQAVNALEEAIDDCVTAPAASVGQTIVVKAVDENGKPTEWEAIDLPTYEEFVFTLEDGTTVTKNIAVKGAAE